MCAPNISLTSISGVVGTHAASVSIKETWMKRKVATAAPRSFTPSRIRLPVPFLPDELQQFILGEPGGAAVLDVCEDTEVRVAGQVDPESAPFTGSGGHGVGDGTQE